MGNSPLQVLYETCKSGGSGDEERVRKILKNNPNLINEDLDIYGDTILILASANNHIKLIKLLLLYNTININKQNTGGWTALHNASLFGHKEIVELLLSHSNININIQGNDGNSALYYAASRGDKEIVELLLSHSNIDINIKKNDGDTALHSASFNGRKDIVKLLLSHSNIDINIQNNDGKLASHICCDAIANKPNKPIILELFENHSKAKTALTSSTLTTTKLFNEGSLSSNNVIPQTALKESRIAKEVKDRELLTLVEEKESPKLQIEGLEEKMREITNNSMKEMERHLQEKENYMKEMDYMKNNRNEIVRVLQDSKKLMVDNLMKEMGKVVNSIKEHVDEKEKECQRLQDQIVRMEYRFEERMKKMEGIMNKLERSNDDLERRLEEKEKECDQLEDQIVRIEGRFESWMKQMESNVDKAIKSKLEDNKRSLVLKSLPLPPNKQTHVFLTHTWREDEKRRNNHDRVGRVNEALQKRGLVTWFDSERLEDKIHETISKALYSTCCVLIFVTREYEKKVNSADDSDYCFYEFNVAAIDRRLANMRIPIVMDGSMLNPDSWEEGLLKAGLGGKVFIDVSSDDEDVFEERCNEVFVRVVKLLNI